VAVSKKVEEVNMPAAVRVRARKVARAVAVAKVVARAVAVAKVVVRADVAAVTVSSTFR